MHAAHRHREGTQGSKGEGRNQWSGIHTGRSRQAYTNKKNQICREHIGKVGMNMAARWVAGGWSLALGIRNAKMPHQQQKELNQISFWKF